MSGVESTYPKVMAIFNKVLIIDGDYIKYCQNMMGAGSNIGARSHSVILGASPRMTSKKK